MNFIKYAREWMSKFQENHWIMPAAVTGREVQLYGSEEASDLLVDMLERCSDYISARSKHVYYGNMTAATKDRAMAAKTEEWNDKRSHCHDRMIDKMRYINDIGVALGMESFINENWARTDFANLAVEITNELCGDSILPIKGHEKNLDDAIEPHKPEDANELYGKYASNKMARRIHDIEEGFHEYLGDELDI